MAENGRRERVSGGEGDSDINERREIRRNYRELMEKTRREQAELTRPDSDGLTHLLGNMTQLFGQVQNLANKAPTSEAVLDAQLLKTASTLGYQKAKKLHVDNKFDPSTFIQKLITFTRGRRLDDVNEVEISEEGWASLGSEAEPAFKRASAFHFMLGSFERDPPRKRARSVAKDKETAGPTVMPEKVKEMGKSHQEVTTEEVERMVGILRHFTEQDDGSVEPISYFEFVVNPHSFSQTVENIFHLSFILKDGHAEIKLDADGLPIVVPAKPHSEEQSRKNITKKQVLVSLDMEQWQELIEAFNITEPIIPSRKADSEDQNGHS